MTDSNRTQVLYAMESVPGTTPAYDANETRIARITGESLVWNIANTVSAELRTDRMRADLIQVGAQGAGAIDFEESFPVTRTFHSDMLRMALFNDWLDAAERYNVTSDSSITQVTAATETFLVANGTPFAPGHLVRASGFTNAGNNGLFTAIAGSDATTLVVGENVTVDEAAPPAGARLKTVGFYGASGDITAGVNSLNSTVRDFTTLGLRVGQWIKIGGSAAGDKFATAANNAFVRITSISANSLGLDNLPAGWGVDAGTGKTIKVWTSDVLRNGVTKLSASFEVGFLAQSVPTYKLFAGMHIGAMQKAFASNQVIRGSYSFLGMGHSVGTVAYGAGVAATTKEVMNAVSNVGRVAENGALVSGPNYIRSLSLSVNNNLRPQDAVGTLGLIGVGVGTCDVMLELETYFGNKDIYERYVNGSASSANVRVTKDGQAVIHTWPRLKFESGGAPVPGENQDVYVRLSARAIRDPSTDCEYQIDRFEEYQA